MNARNSALQRAAESWEGTPFCERSAVKGAGVCCHRLMLEVYVEAGWLPRLTVPDASVKWARAQGRSLIGEWLDTEGAEWFLRAQSIEWERIEPGDLLGFRLARAMHHLVMALPDGRWLHALNPQGAVIAQSIQPRWVRHAERLWRPRLVTCHPSPATSA